MEYVNDMGGSYIRRKTINTRNPRVMLNNMLLCVYLFNAIFIPYDNFALKKLSFFIMVFLNIDVVINGLISKKETRAILLLGVFIPICTILVSAVLTGDLVGNFLSGYTGMIILVYYIVKKNKLDFVKVFVNLTLLLACFINVSALLDKLGIISVFSNPVMAWMFSTSNANIGKSPAYLLGYYLFIKTTPMLLVCLGFLLNDKKYISAVIVLLALALSGTRANAVLGIITFGVAIIIAEKNKSKRILMIGCVILLAGYVLFGQDLLAKYLEFSNSKGNSDQIRQLTLPSIINTWKKDPLSFIIGQGYKSEFFNVGRMSWSSDCELAYWNLLRRVGVIFFAIMMYCYVKPIKHIVKIKKTPAIAMGYVAYLIGAYVNPLLYTSTGLTVLLCVYCFAFSEVNQNYGST